MPHARGDEPGMIDLAYRSGKEIVLAEEEVDEQA